MEDINKLKAEINMIRLNKKYLEDAVYQTNIIKEEILKYKKSLIQLKESDSYTFFELDNLYDEGLEIDKKFNIYKSKYQQFGLQHYKTFVFEEKPSDYFIRELNKNPKLLYEYENYLIKEKGSIQEKQIKKIFEKVIQQFTLSITDSLKKLSEINTNSNNKDSKKDKSDLTLDKVFEDIPKFHKIMEKLVENVYCQPNTYNWIDLKGGYKSTIVFLLKKHLHAQRYYKENKRLTNKEIQIIAKIRLESILLKVTLSKVKLKTIKFRK
jgi:hypothetical protein